MKKTKRYFRLLIAVCVFLAGSLRMNSQEMTLQEAISVARLQGVEALEAKFNFISSYWAYRSYKASRLPSLYLYGTLGDFNRSLTLLQNYETGQMSYASSYYLQNSVGLAVRQNIMLTGGSLSLYSDLSRIDQFGDNKNLTWYTQPITVSYSQPIFSYNRFKWEKLISPKEYEKARRVYIESMEKVTLDVVEAYYGLMLAQMKYDVSSSNFVNTGKMRDVAVERMKLGTVTRDEYLQLELRMLNDSISINENAVAIRQAQMALNSILGYDESAEIRPVTDESLPSVWMDYDFVMQKAMDNSSFDIENQINVLNARSAVASAKADRGISVQLNARFGLSKSDARFRDAYMRPLDQEVVGITFSLPIFDWGLGKGKVQKAKAAEEVVRAQVLQSENDFRRKVFTAVGQFNNQRQQCSSSRRARDIADERYMLMMERFRSGSATVTELNTAQSEHDSATQQYVNDLSSFWNYYYSIRQLTLYDFIGGHDIDVDPEEMIE
ncbi:MAG: TolC family protein [Bacteroidales bacterium]|nr:TolC family protein [Bacteroidales bacterium]